jgi:chemotaxis protein MotB
VSEEEQQNYEKADEAANSGVQEPVRSSPRYGRRIGDSGKSAKMWVVSFTDIMALMLTFFVLMYSMSSPEGETWEEMTSALHKELNKFKGERFDRGPRDTIDISKINYNRALNLNYLKALISSHMEKEEVLKGVNLNSLGGTLVISLPQDLVFESGRAELSEQGSKAVYALALTLSRIKNRIEILGHTDPKAINEESSRYKSNWDLSLARATTVASALRNVGYDRPLTVRGMANAMYDSMPESLPEEQRLALSRRVDLVIKDDDGTLSTFNGLGIE